MASMPTRREETFPQLLLLLQQAGSLLAHTLLTLGSVNSKTIGIWNRIINALHLTDIHLVKNIFNS